MGGDLGELVDTANVLIGNLAANEELDSFKKRLTGTDEDIEVFLHKILDAMLYHVGACGGESTRRYVAAAICACVVEPKLEEDKMDDKRKSQSTLNTLRQLGETWFTHFLFPFYFSHSAQPNQTPSLIATPSRDQTAGLLRSGVESRKSSFRDDLLLRDGYRCIVTGSVDEMHPELGGDYYALNLKACHILRWAVAKFNEQEDKDVYKSAMTTFDILRHFAALPESTLEELQRVVDGLSNGFLVEHNAHVGFNRFYWCLQETEVPNKYKIRIYRRGHWITGAMNPDTLKFVEFKDHSNDFVPENTDGGPSTGQKRKERESSLPLPDPRWIRLHAGIAGIVHMSGAAKFPDKLCKDYRDHDEAPPVRSWEEFERLIAAEDFGRALQSAMIGITAH